MLFDTNVIVIDNNVILISKNVFLFIYFQKILILTQTVSNCTYRRISNTIFTVLCSSREGAEPANLPRHATIETGSRRGLIDM